ncbi:MAG: 3'(2'),5'-bisphosphate nucleotidase CysQ [Bacteroidota bacterium]
MINLENLLDTAKEAALVAGAEIIKIYESGNFSVEAKADNSPLTVADKAAHEAIVSYLSRTEIPILSEEGKYITYQKRKDWEYFWMVDPLDGTKEFVKKNGEFTVNIALVKDGAPILGVVYPPILKDLYWAIKSRGAYLEKAEKIVRLTTSKKDLSNSRLKVVASRSHMSEETKHYIDKLDHPEIVSKGSSLKFLMVASGEADLYPRFGPTMEWDTAAAHVIVTEAGGRVILQNEATPLSYNKEDLLNPYFIVFSH